MLSFVQDLRYALRMLLKSPGFTIVAVVTLALGIGANVATFSVVYAVLLRPLPFPHPEQLVRVFDDLRGPNEHDVGMSAPELWDLQDRSGVFQEISAVARAIRPSVAEIGRFVPKVSSPVPTTSPCWERSRNLAASIQRRMPPRDSLSHRHQRRPLAPQLRFGSTHHRAEDAPR